MNPIDFPETNAVYAKDQPEYTPLPSYKTENGIVVSCWKLSFKERIKLLFTGKLWHLQMTFNALLQPVSMTLKSPFDSENQGEIINENQ